MTRYRQTMTIIIDVVADNISEATDLIQEEYEQWDSALWWKPTATEIVPDDDKHFYPINEEW